MRCADCRWWVVRHDLKVKVEPECDDWCRVCDGWGKCDLSKTSDGKPKHPETLAKSMDNEEYGSRLMTRADFGCVQFAAREAAS